MDLIWLGLHYELPELIRNMRITRLLAYKQALEKTEEYKNQHDDRLQAKKDNLFKIGQFVHLDKRIFLNENEKLADKWEGPYLETKLFDNGAVDCLKPFIAIPDWSITWHISSVAVRKEAAISTL